jgi:cytochrome c-type biogenesis protein CcmE
MKRRYRFAAICLLVCAAVGLCVLSAEVDRWTYPDTEEIATDPGAYDGQQGLLFGDVKSVDRASRTLVITAGTDPERTFTVESVPESVTDSVREGGSIQVFGVLAEQSTVIVATEIVVDYRDSTDFLYVYVASLLGGLLAAGVFLWHWRIDLRNLTFVPRGDR